MTGTTVVTRESPWDDEARGRALRLAEHTRSIDHATNLPMEEAHKEQPFVVEKFKNYAERAVEQKKRVDRDAADKAKWPPGWDDGLHYYPRLHDERRDGPLQPQRPPRSEPRGRRP